MPCTVFIEIPQCSPHRYQVNELSLFLRIAQHSVAYTSHTSSSRVSRSSTTLDRASPVPGLDFNCLQGRVLALSVGLQLQKHQLCQIMPSIVLYRHLHVHVTTPGDVMTLDQHFDFCESFSQSRVLAQSITRQRK